MSSGFCISCNQSSDCCTCETECCSVSESSWTTAEISSCNRGNQGRCCPSTVYCSTFLAQVTPVTNLVSTKQGYVRFQMRKKAGIITLSWEPFSGQIAGNGIDKITVNQTIPHMPAFAHDFINRLQLRGTWKGSFVRVDPTVAENLAFFLDLQANGAANNGDSFNIPASSISWIA